MKRTSNQRGAVELLEFVKHRAIDKARDDLKKLRKTERRNSHYTPMDWYQTNVDSLFHIGRNDTIQLLGVKRGLLRGRDRN